MFEQYVFTEAEIKQARSRLKEMRHIALLCRDAADTEGNREWYLRAKGFEEALRTLGIIRSEPNSGQ